MNDLDAAIGRVRAYLNEMDRVDAARPKPNYANEVHGINDFYLARSDLRLLIAGLEAA